MQKITIIRGTSCPIHMALYDADGNERALTEGERLLLGIRPVLGGTAVLIRAATAADSGGYVWDLKPEDTVSIPAADYLYDINLESGADLIPVINGEPLKVKDNSVEKGAVEV